jgi:hypothetical protein
MFENGLTGLLDFLGPRPWGSSPRIGASHPRLLEDGPAGLRRRFEVRVLGRGRRGRRRIEGLGLQPQGRGRASFGPRKTRKTQN